MKSLSVNTDIYFYFRRTQSERAKIRTHAALVAEKIENMDFSTLYAEILALFNIKSAYSAERELEFLSFVLRRAQNTAHRFLGVYIQYTRLDRLHPFSNARLHFLGRDTLVNGNWNSVYLVADILEWMSTFHFLGVFWQF